MSNGFDRLRRGFTHRRLGLGRTRPSAAALAHADALLTDVGGRIPDDLARDLAPDPVRLALLDFVADIDLAVDTIPAGAQFDHLTLPAIEMSRIETTVPVRRIRVRDRFLLPAMSAATAAVVLIAVFVVGRGTNDHVGSPSTAAATESATLLKHAGLLLDAASTARPTQRTELVREARSDLQHVNRLLPLIPPPNRPPVRSKLQSLEQQTTTAPTTAPTRHPATSGSGTTTTPTPPVSKHQPSHTPPPSSESSGSGTTSGNHHPTGDPQGAPPLGPGHRGQGGFGQGGQGRGQGPLGPGGNAAR